MEIGVGSRLGPFHQLSTDSRVRRAKLFATGRVQVIGDHGVFNDGSRTRFTHLIEAFASGRLGRHPKPFDAQFTIRYLARVRVASSKKGRLGSQVTPFFWRRVCFVVPAISKSKQERQAMSRINRKFLAVLVLVLGAFVSASQYPAAAAQPAQNDNNLQAEVMNKALNKPDLKGVQANAHDGVVTLTGTVKLFGLKEEADRRTHKIKGVQAVSNEIQVAGSDITDPMLEAKLVKAISYDRVGYGTTPFNAISVQVQDGTVTLSGHAYGPIDAASAIALAGYTPGVKNVVNEVRIDPLSPMDDRSRIQLFRSIYGFPTLNKYAIDPAKPIRISVQNGNVTLYGVVDSQTDKNVAGIRANSVPGIFKVTNDLTVAGPREKNSKQVHN
jgi:hyperosmotically inducible periplasmic protein